MSQNIRNLHNLYVLAFFKPLNPWICKANWPSWIPFHVSPVPEVTYLHQHRPLQFFNAVVFGLKPVKSLCAGGGRSLEVWVGLHKRFPLLSLTKGLRTKCVQSRFDDPDLFPRDPLNSNLNFRWAHIYSAESHPPPAAPETVDSSRAAPPSCSPSAPAWPLK